MRAMPLVHDHLDRCRRESRVLYATTGVGFYGLLTLAILGGAALSALRP